MAFILSFSPPKNYRTDDVAILRSFVNCQLGLTLQKKKKKNNTNREENTNILFSTKKRRGRREKGLLFLIIKRHFAFHLQRQLKAQPTWKSITKRYLKSVTNPCAVN